jgi:hypothetical protein
MHVIFEKIDAPRNTLINEAWTVLADAKDLNDMATAMIARRIIDDHLNGRTPRQADVQIITHYFR